MKILQHRAAMFEHLLLCAGGVSTAMENKANSIMNKSNENIITFNRELLVLFSTLTKL